MDIKRGKLKGFSILVLLILLLGVIDSAWIFSYKKVISTEIIGEKKSYTLLHEFDSSLLLNTSNGSASKITSLKISDLKKDVNVTFEISTTHKSLDTECSSNFTYTNDCDVTVTFNRTSVGTENILADEENFTLFKSPTINFINYKIWCVENSCPQRINSTITLTEIR